MSQGAGLWNIPAGARGLYLYWGRAVTELRKTVPEVEVYPVFTDGPEDAASRVGAMLARTEADLLIVQFSGSSPGVGRPGAKTAAAAAIRRIFEAAKAAGTPVIAAPVPPLMGPLRRIDFAELLADEAKRAGICTADTGRLSAYRGLGFEGEFYVAPDQLNVQGHQALSKMLLEILNP
jgi:hypothetical protein